jgi:hypothetical protein
MSSGNMKSWEPEPFKPMPIQHPGCITALPLHYPATVAEINKEIAALEAKRAQVLKALEIRPDVLVNAANFLLATFKGRTRSDADEGGSCGGVGFQTHVEQCADPRSWVHASLKSWLERGLK